MEAERCQEGKHQINVVKGVVGMDVGGCRVTRVGVMVGRYEGVYVFESALLPAHVGPCAHA